MTATTPMICTAERSQRSTSGNRTVLPSSSGASSRSRSTFGRSSEHEHPRRAGSSAGWTSESIARDVAGSIGTTSVLKSCEPRSGNRPSHEGAPEYFARAIALCRRAGWNDVLLRGDTALCQTTYFDRWDDDGVRFIFGYDASAPMIGRADGIDESEYRELVRRADDVFADREERAKQPWVKEQIIREREYKNLVLAREDLAEFDHRPSKAKHTYRMVVLRKTIVEERGQLCLGQHYRYFFYVTSGNARLRSGLE